MDIIFSSKKLQKILNDEREMLKSCGLKRSKRLKVVMAALRAASTLSVFAPPYSPPHRCHQLKGNRRNQFSFDLDGQYRLLIKPALNPIPRLKDGGIDWKEVTVIEIIEIGDTHG